MNALKLDPLYTIFEKHLYEFDDEGKALTLSDNHIDELITRIVEDYFQFLLSRKVTVPMRWRAQIEQELQEQVRQMLIKKLYGCLSIEEYKNQESADLRRKRRVVQRKYKKLF